MTENSNDNNDKERKEIAPFWRSGFELDRVFDNFRRDFENVFSSTLGAKPFSVLESATACDLIDEGDKFVVTADMPRMKKEEINLNVGDDYIDISAEHKESEEEKKKKYIRKEHRGVSIHRRLSLPERVKSGDVKAKLDDGVLKIEIPKEKPSPEPKTTKIKIE